MKLPEGQTDIEILLNEVERYNLICALLEYDSPIARRDRHSRTDDIIWSWQQHSKHSGIQTIIIRNQISPDK